MITPPPPDEARRLDALKQYDVLDTLPDPALDDLAALAAQICETPIATISLVDEHRLWFKARVGVETAEIPREGSFCAHAMRAQDVLTVADAARDPEFAQNALVSGESGIRFYAGAPLITPDGVRLGALCVMDRRPRTLTSAQQNALRILGRQVMTQFELRRRGRELQASEGKLRAIFQAEPECVKLLGADSVLHEMNAAGLRLIEAENLDSVTGRQLLPLVVPEDREAVSAMLNAVAAGEKRIVQYRIVGLKGTPRWIEMSGAPFRDETTGGNLVLGISCDITARKKAEELQRFSEARFASVFRSNPAAIGINTLETGRLIDVNEQMCEFFGWRREEVIGKTIFELGIWSNPAQRQPLIEQVRATGSARDYEVCLRRRNGEEREVLLSMELVSVPGETEPMLIAMFIDVTQRRKAEDALRESEERFRRTFEQAAVGMAHVSSQGLFLRVNDKLCAIVGYMREELLCLTFSDLTVIEDRPVGEEARSAMLAGGISSYTTEKRYRRKNGEIVWVNLVTTLERTAEGVPEYFITVFEDITARKLAEFRLRRLNRLHTVLGKIGEATVRIRDRQQLFETVCRIVVDDGLLRMAFVACVGGKKLRVRPMASFGEGREYLSGLGQADVGEPLSEGVIVATLRTGRHEFCNYLGRTTGDEPRQERALRHGFRSVAAFPLKLSEVTIAALVLFAGEAGYFLDDEIRLMAAVANNISFALDAQEQEIRRQNVERALRASEQQFSSAFEYAAVGAALIAPEGRFLKVNRALCQMLGRSEETLLARSVQDVTPAGDFKELINSLNQLVTGEAASFQTEQLFVHQNGSLVWTLLSVSLMRDEAGSPIHFISQIQDITEQRFAREALKLSEERFRLLAKATDDAVWDWNMLDNVLWWNEGLETLFGYQRDAVPPTLEFWKERLHPDDRARTLDLLKDTINQGQVTFVDEYRFLRADGTYASVLARGHIIRNAAAQPIRMIGGMTDLSERIEADSRIAEQAALIDKARDAIIVRNLEHRITYWNKSAERLYGWTAGEVMNTSVRELMYPDPTVFDAAMTKMLAHGAWFGELVVKGKDGREIVEESRWTLVSNQAGEPQSVLVINTDISERTKLEQQFLRAQRTECIGTLAGGIAHDLNNVLGPIIMSIDLLKMKLTDEFSLELLDTIRYSARHGADMVSQVLSFSRGVEGRRTEVHVEQIIAEVEKIANETFLKHIRVRTLVPENLMTILGDPTQLHQVVLNLCVNARDAMPNGGDIVISAENTSLEEQAAALESGVSPGSFVCLKVEDNGVGMPAAVIGRIFDPFFTTKDIGAGTGLGLSTSLAIVKSHGGFIQVRSEPGRGSVFEVYLPAQIKTEEIQAVDDMDEFPSGNGELILVVDDEVSVRKITQRTLEAFGYRVILAVDGSKALEEYIAHGAEIAAVITDMMMPVMDGAATIAALRKINPSVRIIGASGFSASGPTAQAVSLGLKHFLPKPFTAESLLKELRLILAAG